MPAESPSHVRCAQRKNYRLKFIPNTFRILAVVNLRLLIFFFCAILLLVNGNVIGENLSDSVSTRFSFIPSKKIIGIFTADTRAHRIGFQKNLDANSYTASMGGLFPVVSAHHKKMHFQFSVAGTTYISLIRRIQSGSVENTDYYGDLLLDGWLSNHWGFRLGLGHTSQHLADDAIIGGLPFSNYAKDYGSAFLCYRKNKMKLLLYAGGSYAYNFKTAGDISGKIQWQFGLEHSLVKLASRQYLFYAADFKFREELNFDPTYNFQVGYKMTNSSGRTFRFAIDRTGGTDERGYFQPAKRNFFHLGLYFDL